MRALMALFGKSPFKPLQAHMEKVRECVERIRPLFDALLAGNRDEVEKLVNEICRLESEADAIKNDIRGHLPKSIFLPIDRRDLLEILDHQDSIADISQDIAVLLTLRDLQFHPDLKEPLDNLLKEVTTVCQLAADITREFDELLETVITIRSYVVAALTTVAVATLAVAGLVFGLSLRLRQREIETIVKIGGSRAAVTGLLASEVAFVLVLGAVLAGLLTGLFARYGDSAIRALFFA